MSFYKLMGFSNVCVQCKGAIHESLRLCPTCLAGQRPALELERRVTFETRNHLGAFHKRANKRTQMQQSLRGEKGMRSTASVGRDSPWQEHLNDDVPMSHLWYHGDNLRYDT